MKMSRLAFGVAVLAVVGAGCVTGRIGSERARLKTTLESDAQFVSLTALPPVEVMVGYGKFLVGTNSPSAGNKPIPFDQTCGEYLFAHATSLVRYDIPPEAKRFFAVGYSSGSKSVSYRVLADDRIIFQSKELVKYPECAVVMDAPIPSGSKTLKLIVDNMGNGNSDWSYWCWPRLYK
jgi:hypothetical protein